MVNVNKMDEAVKIAALEFLLYPEYDPFFIAEIGEDNGIEKANLENMDENLFELLLRLGEGVIADLEDNENKEKYLQRLKEQRRE